MSGINYDFYPEREVDGANATERFYAGLEQLAGMPNVAANFGWCLAQLSRQPDYEAQFRGMVEFYKTYHAAGLDKALEAIQDAEGIPVDVMQYPEGEHSLTRISPGRIVGLTGGSDRKYRDVFYGYACTAIDNAGEAFVPVAINATHPGEVLRIETIPEAAPRRRRSIFGFEINF